jgi:hypothetical protein
LILVLAIPAARNILFALLAGALGLGLVGLVLAGLALLAWWLWSIDWKALKAPAAKTPITFSLKNIQSADVILVLVFIVVVAYIVHDYRKLKKWVRGKPNINGRRGGSGGVLSWLYSTVRGRLQGPGWLLKRQKIPVVSSDYN